MPVAHNELAHSAAVVRHRDDYVGAVRIIVGVHIRADAQVFGAAFSRIVGQIANAESGLWCDWQKASNRLAPVEKLGRWAVMVVMGAAAAVCRCCCRVCLSLNRSMRSIATFGIRPRASETEEVIADLPVLATFGRHDVVLYRRRAACFLSGAQHNAQVRLQLSPDHLLSDRAAASLHHARDRRLLLSRLSLDRYASTFEEEEIFDVSLLTSMGAEMVSE